MEEFLKKKEAGINLETEIEQVEAKKDDVAAGVPSQLITKLPLGEDRDIKSGLKSPIPQVDGLEPTEKVMFAFKSEYGEEDIEYSLSKILPEKTVHILVSRVQISPRSADHLCMLELKEVDGQNFVWPCMNSSDTEVLREIKRM